MAQKVIDYAVIVLIAILFGLAIPVTYMGLMRIMTTEARTAKNLEETEILHKKIQQLKEQIDGRNP